MKKKQILKKVTKTVSAFLCSTLILSGMFSFQIRAEDTAAEAGRIEVAGNVYEFGKDSSYEIHKQDPVSTAQDGETYGSFSITGSISDVSENKGVPAYHLSDGNLDIFYNYGDELLSADEDEWHLVEDKGKTIGEAKLKSRIGKGTVLVQTSKDRETWFNAKELNNAFSNFPIQTESIYTTTDVELNNGSFYRILVAYETGIRTGERPWIIPDKFDYKKYAEVYEFYAFNDSGEAALTDSSPTYSLGTKQKVKNFQGYSGTSPIEKGDLHYGWDLGNFFVSGYTDQVSDSAGNPVFLKTVGDKVTLWFKLNENIDALQGKSNLKITAHPDGYDQYFETPKMNFGKGALIVRSIDHNNTVADQEIYTDYLAANTLAGADTNN